jgi:glyoxylase-like metal-dependent hydrolase (beta-lactamase superfamily II)
MTYELYAIRYATRPARRPEHFIGGDAHDTPMPMDYFIWVAKGPERSFVIDTGFTREMAEQRKRIYLRDPAESLSLVGLDAAMVDTVILTHLHYDHVGTFHKFPKAEFHVQEDEVHYATGRYMRYPQLAHPYEPSDIAGMVMLNFEQRVRMHTGKVDLAPGISLHPVGGHTAGLQFVRVLTKRGWVVIASDASHYYENMDGGRPFTAAFHVGKMHEAFDALRAAADSRDHIVAGHDPLVMQLYPAPSPELEGMVVRLDVDPVHPA